MNKIIIVGIIGVIFIFVGCGFLYSGINGEINGYVMYGGRYEKKRYDEKDNPKEYREIVRGAIMTGVIFTVVGLGMAIIGFTGKKR